MEKINFVNKPNTDTPVNDKNLNKMQDNIEEEFLKLENYSTEETFTGKYWIDGKKIYRKVVKYTAPNTIGATGTTTNINIPHSISNFNELIFIKAKRGNNPLPSIGGWNATDRTTYVPEVNSTNIILRIINDTWSTGSSFTFVIEYTKTTN